jgi:hypothetical protein
MAKPNDDARDDGKAGYFIGFALFVPALLLLYVLFAGANRLFFGSL